MQVELSWISKNLGGETILKHKSSIKFGQPKHEEFYIPNPSLEGSEIFHLRVEGFSRGIGFPVVKVIHNRIFMQLDRLHRGFKVRQMSQAFIDRFVPASKSSPAISNRLGMMIDPSKVHRNSVGLMQFGKLSKHDCSPFLLTFCPVFAWFEEYIPPPSQKLLLRVPILMPMWLISFASFSGFF